MDFTSASAVIPASVVVPLTGAALMAGFSRLLPRWARDVIAIAVAIATCTLTLILMVSSAGRPMIYWFSGWRPAGGMVIGIDYAVGPLGAGMASLAGLLVTAALVYCWRYFDGARWSLPRPDPDLPGRQRRLLPHRGPDRPGPGRAAPRRARRGGVRAAGGRFPDQGRGRSAVVGAVMALAQTQLKRMLAFLTMSHLGIYLIGVGLLTQLGLAGAALLVIGDALTVVLSSGAVLRAAGRIWLGCRRWRCSRSGPGSGWHLAWRRIPRPLRRPSPTVRFMRRRCSARTARPCPRAARSSPRPPTRRPRPAC
jgi:hypothetical protein